MSEPMGQWGSLTPAAGGRVVVVVQGSDSSMQATHSHRPPGTPEPQPSPATAAP